MFRTILVPVDLEEKDMAKPALDRAIALADQSGASLRLINVQPLLPATFLDSIPADFDEQQRQWAEQTLAQMAAKIPLPIGRVSHCVRTGGIYPEVLAEAEHWGADLIVIGSHRPSMSTYLLGSNATTIVRHALCSVLVVRD
ncbi:MAG: universal stress protein [Alphaproteobacteria bacterium]|nr:universal stress protein [Alphaproteobacteria bacterium]